MILYNRNMVPAKCGQVRVKFDAGKVSFHVLHRSRGGGGNSKVLGIDFDTALLMHDACHEIAVEAGWRLKTLLRTRRFHNTREMMNLYKAQILSFIESRTVGIHHASPSVLQCVDRVQRRFLREMGISDRESLFDWKLAPLASRRAIAMLGLLYRVAKGTVPESLRQLFQRDGRERVGIPSRTHAASLRHPLQFLEFVAIGGHNEVFRRSCFGLVTVWNMLPVDVVHAKSVESFPKALAGSFDGQGSSGQRFQRFLHRCQANDRFEVPVLVSVMFLCFQCIEN